MRIRSGFTLIVCAVAAMTLTGCTQMTRHSNTMVFGTQTKVGLDVGVDATSVPRVTVGYGRQEAVLMPLVANTAESGKNLKPCAIPAAYQNGKEFHPCRLVSRRYESGQLHMEDSFSVLASFGGKFDGSANAGNAQAKGGIAQYFATGVAAQILAAAGGAALVSVSDASSESAKNSANADAAKAVLTPQAAQKEKIGADRYQKAVELGKQLALKRSTMSAFALQCTTDSTKKKKVTDSINGNESLKPNVKRFESAKTELDFAKYIDFIGTDAEGDFYKILLAECL